MELNSQDSEIINEGVLSYIMNNLGTSQPYMFLQDNEYDENIYNPEHQQHLNNQIKSEHQLQQHLNQDRPLLQQPLTDDLQLQQPQQHLNNDNRQLIDGGGEVGVVVAPPPPHTPQHTSPTGMQPCLTTYPGCYDFHVTLANTPHHGRHAWVYSSKLQKVYIDINKVLMLQFRMNTVDVKGLCVRALLVYSDPDNAMHAVNRCTVHVFKCDPNRLAHADIDTCNCRAFNLCGHVITVRDHPLARYDWNASSGRHSVLVPLGQAWAAGQDAAATVAYQFGCKTSCNGGMSRRPVMMVFTLEDQFGDVLGRSTLAVKICSCPKRDKDREESSGAQLSHTTTKVPLQDHTTKLLLTVKKRKLQHTDNGSSSKLQHIDNGSSKMQHIDNGSSSKLLPGVLPAEVAKDANQPPPGIDTLLEEVQKLNTKVDQLNNMVKNNNNKVDEMFSFLRELALNLRDDNNCRPNKNNGYPYEPEN